MPISFYTFAILHNTFVIPFFKIAKVFFIFPIPFNKIAIFYNTFAIPFFKIAKVEIVFPIPFIVFAISFNTFAIPFNTFGILFFKTGCFEAIFEALFFKTGSLFFVVRQKKGYLYADSRNDFPHLKKSLDVFWIFSVRDVLRFSLRIPVMKAINSISAIPKCRDCTNGPKVFGLPSLTLQLAGILNQNCLL